MNNLVGGSCALRKGGVYLVLYRTFTSEQHVPQQNEVKRMEEPQVEFGQLWRTINHQVHDRLRQAFQDGQLHFGALVLIRQIRCQPGITVSELAREAGMVKSHVSKMMEQLEHRGYVEKRPDEADQRLVRVYLTPVAVETMADWEARAIGVWRSIAGELKPEEMSDVLRGLRLMLAALERSNVKGGVDTP